MASRCPFHTVLGVDVDLDEDGTVWFLEANVTPALGYQAPFEVAQKDQLLRDVAALVFGATVPDNFEEL